MGIAAGGFAHKAFSLGFNVRDLLNF